MSDASELNKAIKAHSMWKVRLKDAIETGKSEFTPAQASAHHLCDFGKWLATLPAADKALDEYKQIVPLHEKFHAEAAKILHLGLDGQRDKAHDALTNIRSEFTYTSAQLINTISSWKRKIS